VSSVTYFMPGRPIANPCIAAVIPCLNEEIAIGAVVEAVRRQGVSDVVVVDGGSADRTAVCAKAAGARVVVERERGYGRAIQAGIRAVDPKAEILVFLDGDGSDRADFIPSLVSPIAQGQFAFVQGSRTRGECEPGSLSIPQRVAGHLAGTLIGWTYGARFTDMSPFRAISRQALDSLAMQDMTYGWNLEMLMRVAAAGLPATEIAVGQRRRVGGVSKVSGNLGAGIRAAWVIGLTFIRLALTLAREQKSAPAIARAIPPD
jgi:glycosyltransferase involved in cell wall biosynthesis